MACGRRWGKTVLLIDRATGFVTSGLPVAWYSPTYKLLADAWREAKIIWHPIIQGKNESEKRIEFVTGGSIEFWSLEDPDASRGRQYAAVFVDEAAHARHLQYAWENVVSASMLDFDGGTAWFASTPNGRNYFWQLHRTENWQSWTYPTTANPTISPEYVEEQRLALPERVFRQEHLAEFIENEGAVFRNIAANMTAPSTTPHKHEGHRIYIGVDWGKHNDYTCLSVFCADCAQEVDKDRFNRIDYIFQRERVAAMDAKWQPKRILAEQNAMEANLEMLQRDIGSKVRGWTMTGTNKPGLITSLAVALEKQEAEWLPDPVWTGELEAFEQSVNKNTGRSSYSAPEGMHDDTVIARALAWQAATSGRLVYAF